LVIGRRVPAPSDRLDPGAHPEDRGLHRARVEPQLAGVDDTGKHPGRVVLGIFVIDRPIHPDGPARIQMLEQLYPSSARWVWVGEAVAHDLVTAARTYSHVTIDETELDYAASNIMSSSRR
jgi:hypothetical protein